MTILEIGIVFLVIVFVIALMVGLIKKFLFIAAIIGLVWLICKIINAFSKP